MPIAEAVIGSAVAIKPAHARQVRVDVLLHVEAIVATLAIAMIQSATATIQHVDVVKDHQSMA